jgi:hypothetical protein
MGEVIFLGLAVAAPAALFTGLLRMEVHHVIAVIVATILSIGMTAYLTGVNVAPATGAVSHDSFLEVLKIYFLAFNVWVFVALGIGLVAGWYGIGLLKRGK